VSSLLVTIHKMCNFGFTRRASVKVVFITTMNTIDLSGPSAAVDAAFDHIKSKYIDAIYRDCLELCLPGHTSQDSYFCV